MSAPQAPGNRVNPLPGGRGSIAPNSLLPTRYDVGAATARKRFEKTLK
jgi:hypothetical protein